MSLQVRTGSDIAITCNGLVACCPASVDIGGRPDVLRALRVRARRHERAGPQESVDVAAAVTHLAAAPWRSGAVGLFGVSYISCLQLQVAMHCPEGLRAVFAPYGVTDFYRCSLYHRRMLSYGSSSDGGTSWTVCATRAGRCAGAGKSAWTTSWPRRWPTRISLPGKLGPIPAAKIARIKVEGSMVVASAAADETTR